MKYQPGRRGRTDTHDHSPVTKASGQACHLGTVTFCPLNSQSHPRQPQSVAWWVNSPSVILRGGADKPSRQARLRGHRQTCSHTNSLEKTAPSQPASLSVAASQPASQLFPGHSQEIESDLSVIPLSVGQLPGYYLVSVNF